MLYKRMANRWPSFDGSTADSISAEVCALILRLRDILRLADRLEAA